MKNKKSIVDTYYCEVYDVYLVVANKYTSLEDLQKKYMYADGVELDNNMLDCVAVTAKCKNKQNNCYTVLVKYNHDSYIRHKDKKSDLVNTCSHEATHVALDIYELIEQNVCFCSAEPFCYLQAWAAECIYKTLTKKV